MMFTQKAVILLHIFLTFCGVIRSARILAALPLTAESHHRMFQPLLKTLARAGHEVVVYSPFPVDDPPTNYTDVYLDNYTTEVEWLKTITRVMLELPSWKCQDVLMHSSHPELWLKKFFEHQKFKKLVQSKEKFDLIITEPFTGQEYVLILGHVFKAPIIGLQAFFTNCFVNINSGNALSLAYVPDPCLPLSNRMSFQERLVNSFTILRFLYLYHNKYLPLVESQMKTFVPDMPPLADLISKVSLVFTHSHMTTNYAEPLTPNIIPVGGIHITDVKPLPKEMKSFMDGAEHGVVLFSLGTYTPDELQSKDYFKMYINVFKKLRQRVLWKTRKENIEGLPDNVMTAKWMPQRDILAHPKCVLFITHGGLLSQHEAVHFGVPVVGIPQFFDQNLNVRYYEEKEVGVGLDPKDLTEEKISTAIQTILNNPKYRENMQRLSQIFRDRPLSPAETVVFWTEYVMRHGGAEHLRPASTQLTWYQRALLDVLAAIFALVLAVSSLGYWLCRKLLSVVRGKTKIFTPKNKAD